MTEKNIDILTASCRDYCDSKSKNLSDYELRGIVAGGSNLKDALENLVRVVPQNTEVITNLILSQESYVEKLFVFENDIDIKKVSKEYNLMGVCLIPKEK